MAESLVKCCYNGTEYYFVCRDPAQIEDLKCPICLELVYEPVLTICGHLFCQKCVRSQTQCPTCRKKLQCMRNQRDERRVKCLKVLCPNCEKGCKWQGDLGDTAQHTGTKCHMETIHCPTGCKEKILRGSLKGHAITCTQRDYKCPYCQFESSFANVTTTHFTVCDYFPLKCPAGCCYGCSRMKMATHLAKCTEELVPCTYAPIGCKEVIKREQLQTHMDNKKDYHVQRAMEMVMQLGTAVTELSMSIRLIASGEAKPDASLLSLPFRPWLESRPTCYPLPPLVFKIDEFQKKKENSYSWFSDPVYSHFGGYKMCLRVDAKVQFGTHVSVYIYLMQGHNDDNLKWPFEWTIKVSLLNQLEDRQHHTKQVWSHGHNVPETCSGRVTEGGRAKYSWGYGPFIRHQDLIYKDGKNCQYLKDDILFFRVECFEPKID